MTANSGEMSLADWHRRYLQQAGWTQDVRRHLLAKAGLPSDARVLEVGCGTGAVMNRIAAETQYHLMGIDLNFQTLAFTQSTDPDSYLAQADGGMLPFADGCFDAVYCHYLLLWVGDPMQVLREMRRVTRPGGAVIALAEPDHAARIDAPLPLDALGRLQTTALTAQGANTRMGRLLGQSFKEAGLELAVNGLLGAEWTAPRQTPDSLEWETIRSDLMGMVNEAQLAKYQAADRAAWQNGVRVLFVPTFYALGIVPT